MRERSWGRIVNVGSTWVREPIPGLALSNSHRMAAVGFFKTLAGEVAAQGIAHGSTITTERIRNRQAGRKLGLVGGDRGHALARVSGPPAWEGAEDAGDLVLFFARSAPPT